MGHYVEVYVTRVFLVSKFECMAGNVALSTPLIELPRNRRLTLCSSEVYLDYSGTCCYILILIKIMGWQMYHVLPRGGRRPERGHPEDLCDKFTVTPFASFLLHVVSTARRWLGRFQTLMDFAGKVLQNVSWQAEPREPYEPFANKCVV